MERLQCNDRVMSPKEVAEMLNISSSTLWRIRQQGLGFPKQINVSLNRKGYLLSEVLTYIRQRQDAE